MRLYQNNRTFHEVISKKMPPLLCLRHLLLVLKAPTFGKGRGEGAGDV